MLFLFLETNLPDIFYLVDEQKYLYPKIGIDVDLNQENIIEGRPQCLMYNSQTKVYYDPFSGEEYLLIKELEDVEKIRQTITIRHNAAEMAPIYCNTMTNKYYFPVSATLEGKIPSISQNLSAVRVS